MDWKKIKKILIIALLIANAVLFIYINYNNIRLGNESSRMDFSKEVEGLLEEKDIKIDTNIPRKVEKLPSLLVSLETSTEEDINERYFNGNGKIVRPSTDLAEISRGDEYINLVNNRRIFYENRIKENKYKITNLEDAQEIAKKFLLDKKYDNRDIYLSYYSIDGDKYILNYTKIYENIPVESSYTNFVIDNRGVLSMDRLWLNVLDESEQKIYLPPAPRLLLSLIDNNDYYNKTIEKITTCFYFNPEDQGYIEDITRAVRGRAIPAWKVKFSDGEYTVLYNY
ncbi:two-component system regulatory protein YycI [Peptoniphilus rhinitidis]|uniref:two-component system regulatory protein YycI n=1 Tax=Peptoniphilus rhinitidis TaxID=1175452 RepID=UPI002355D8A5|nr:two-component system regulatory protein YycI [Peptoniphilus rhinitidis]